jgi:hypothetical protein
MYGFNQIGPNFLETIAIIDWRKDTWRTLDLLHYGSYYYCYVTYGTNDHALLQFLPCDPGMITASPEIEHKIYSYVICLKTRTIKEHNAVNVPSFSFLTHNCELMAIEFQGAQSYDIVKYSAGKRHKLADINCIMQKNPYVEYGNPKSDVYYYEPDDAKKYDFTNHILNGMKNGSDVVSVCEDTVYLRIDRFNIQTLLAISLKKRFGAGVFEANTDTATATETNQMQSFSWQRCCLGPSDKNMCLHEQTESHFDLYIRNGYPVVCCKETCTHGTIA